jgi:hypothetical protein
MGKRRSSKSPPQLAGDAIMGGQFSKLRSTPRIRLRRTAWLTFKSCDAHESVGLVKDISVKGIFFYCDFAPAVGSQLDFVVEFLSGQDQARLHLKGAVVRVEQLARGSAPGVAVSFKSRRRKRQ